MATNSTSSCNALSTALPLLPLPRLITSASSTVPSKRSWSAQSKASRSSQANLMQADAVKPISGKGLAPAVRQHIHRQADAVNFVEAVPSQPILPGPSQASQQSDKQLQQQRIHRLRGAPTTATPPTFGSNHNRNRNHSCVPNACPQPCQYHHNAHNQSDPQTCTCDSVTAPQISSASNSPSSWPLCSSPPGVRSSLHVHTPHRCLFASTAAPGNAP